MVYSHIFPSGSNQCRFQVEPWLGPAWLSHAARSSRLSLRGAAHEVALHRAPRLRQHAAVVGGDPAWNGICQKCRGSFHLLESLGLPQAFGRDVPETCESSMCVDYVLVDVGSKGKPSLDILLLF